MKYDTIEKYFLLIIKYLLFFPLALIIILTIEIVNLFSYKYSVITLKIIMKFLNYDITKDKDYYLTLYNLKMFNKKYGVI